MLFNREPARILAFIGAALMLAVEFGLGLSGHQVNRIMVFADAAIILLVGEATRSRVVAHKVADKQMEIAKASAADRPTKDIIQEAKETV